MVWNVVAILLLLLKILGILVLLILGIVALILFVPLRYRVWMNVYEDKQVRGRVSWLSIVLRAVFCYENGENRWKLCVFGIPVMSGGGEKKEDAVKPSREGKRKTKKRQRLQRKQEPKEKPEEMQASQEENQVQKKEKPEELQVFRGENKARKTVENKQQKAHRAFFSRIHKLWEQIRDFFHMLKRLYLMGRQKIHSFHDLAELLREDYAKRFICIAKDNVVHLWKQLRPRKITGDIVFGTGDPCTTGQALGGIAVLYGWVGPGVHITPDFQEKRFEGKLEARGRISLITLLVIAVKLIFNKDFKRLRQEMEQWKEDF